MTPAERFGRWAIVDEPWGFRVVSRPRPVIVVVLLAITVGLAWLVLAGVRYLPDRVPPRQVLFCQVAIAMVGALLLLVVAVASQTITLASIATRVDAAPPTAIDASAGATVRVVEAPPHGGNTFLVIVGRGRMEELAFISESRAAAIAEALRARLRIASGEPPASSEPAGVLRQGRSWTIEARSPDEVAIRFHGDGILARMPITWAAATVSGVALALIHPAMLLPVPSMAFLALAALAVRARGTNGDLRAAVFAPVRLRATSDELVAERVFSRSTDIPWREVEGLEARSCDVGGYDWWWDIWIARRGRWRGLGLTLDEADARLLAAMLEHLRAERLPGEPAA